ncbi:MAG: hypothetical protein GY804_11710 [Alphaproteobacteria bacterium]|nr:hypothetical protein [Alphaproteobacteria bacterium]
MATATTYIQERFPEKGYKQIKGDFLANGVAYTPDTATYKLTDFQGTVINNLDDIAIPGYTTSYIIELNCEDLAIPITELTGRELLISTTYNGDCQKHRIIFYIEDFVTVENG